MALVARSPERPGARPPSLVSRGAAYYLVFCGGVTRGLGKAIRARGYADNRGHLEKVASWQPDTGRHGDRRRDAPSTGWPSGTTMVGPESLSREVPVMSKSRWGLFLVVMILASGVWAGSQALGSFRASPVVAAPAGEDCCSDPTCPPGCSPDCPPDCCAPGSRAGVAAKPKYTCPPCPLCPGW
jgi:hypothetical protein